MPPSSSVPRCIACVVLPSISPFGASLDTAILSYPPVQETGTIIPVQFLGDIILFGSIQIRCVLSSLSKKWVEKMKNRRLVQIMQLHELA